MGRLFVTLSEIAKKLGKVMKYTPHFQSAFGTAEFPRVIKSVFKKSMFTVK